MNHFNATGPGSIAALEQQGLWFFITTQASSHAVPSLGQFATGGALAIARALVRFPRPRVLVLCDTGNRASTEPAQQHFRAELARLAPGRCRPARSW